MGTRVHSTVRSECPQTCWVDSSMCDSSSVDAFWSCLLGSWKSPSSSFIPFPSSRHCRRCHGGTSRYPSLPLRYDIRNGIPMKEENHADQAKADWSRRASRRPVAAAAAQSRLLGDWQTRKGSLLCSRCNGTQGTVSSTRILNRVWDDPIRSSFLFFPILWPKEREKNKVSLDSRP